MLEVFMLDPSTNGYEAHDERVCSLLMKYMKPSKRNAWLLVVPPPPPLEVLYVAISERAGGLTELWRTE